MTINDLVAAAEAIQLPCVDLVEAEAGANVVAHWGGSRSDFPEKFPREVTQFTARRHIISFDWALVQKLGIEAHYPFAVTEWTRANGETILRDENIRPGGTPVKYVGAVELSAREAVSFPATLRCARSKAPNRRASSGSLRRPS